MHVAILGCGYVGCAIAETLVGAGHTVTGVRRSADGIEEVESTGAAGVMADMTDPASLTDVAEADALVIAASAAGRDATETRELLVYGLEDAIEHFAIRDRPPSRVVYTSSTGVYGNYHGAWVDESTPLAPTAPKTAVLAEAELACQEAAERHDIEPVVARLGGVYGPGRYRIEPTLQRPVYPGFRNLVHRADAAGALAQFTTEGADGHRTVIVVDDEPIERYDFVSWLAEAVGVDPPPRADPATLGADQERSLASIRRLRESKRCDNGRLRDLGYVFRYPTVREGYAEAVEAYRRG